MEKISFFRFGIDTIQIEIAGIHEIKVDNKNIFKHPSKDNDKLIIRGLGEILGDKTMRTSKGNTRMAIRGFRLSSITGMLLLIEVLKEIIGQEVEIGVVRVDVATDSKEFLKDNINLARLFLECLTIARGKENVDVFKTIKGLGKEGNIKLSNGRTVTTWYDCADKKNREANTRLENRTIDIRSSSSNKEIMENEFKKYIQELKGLELLVEKVENKYIKELAKIYKGTIGKKYITFSEFVACMDSQGYIMTTGILKGLMQEIGLTIGYKKFVEKFRKTRKETLNFTTKTELKKLVKDLEKNLKIALKN